MASRCAVTQLFWVRPLFSTKCSVLPLALLPVFSVFGDPRAVFWRCLAMEVVEGTFWGVWWSLNSGASDVRFPAEADRLVSQLAGHRSSSHCVEEDPKLADPSHFFWLHHK